MQYTAFFGLRHSRAFAFGEYVLLSFEVVTTEGAMGLDGQTVPSYQFELLEREHVPNEFHMSDLLPQKFSLLYDHCH